jgi:hypothetical protein
MVRFNGNPVEVRMKIPWVPLFLVLAGSALGSGCTLLFGGAQCEDTQNCPYDDVCVDGTCMAPEKAAEKGEGTSGSGSADAGPQNTSDAGAIDADGGTLPDAGLPAGDGGSSPFDAGCASPRLYFADTDGDGDGDATNQVQACTLPPNFSENPSDCDDTNPTIFNGTGCNADNACVRHAVCVQGVCAGINGCDAECGTACGATCPTEGCCVESCSGGNCNETCAGGCSCDRVCDGANNCRTTCEAGSRCHVAALATNTAAITCTEAICKLECVNGVNTCELSCPGDSICELVCNGTATCDLLDCANPTTCLAGIQVCNRGC